MNVTSLTGTGCDPTPSNFDAGFTNSSCFEGTVGSGLISECLAAAHLRHILACTCCPLTRARRSAAAFDTARRHRRQRPLHQR